MLKRTPRPIFESQTSSEPTARSLANGSCYDLENGGTEVPLEIVGYGCLGGEGLVGHDETFASAAHILSLGARLPCVNLETLVELIEALRALVA